MTKKEKLARAYELGKQAFNNGKKCVPAHDNELINVLKGYKMGESINELKAWSKGWHEANLAAPINGKSIKDFFK